MGGAVRALEGGWVQREIADSAYASARRKGAGEEGVIGVNKHVEPPEPRGLDLQRVDPAVNFMPLTIELVRARAPLGEIVARLREVWGASVERPVF